MTGKHLSAKDEPCYPFNMEMLQCSQCKTEFEHQLEQCPHCGTPVPIPNYPRFGGGWVFIAMWIFFVVLIIVLLVSMFTV